MSEIEELKHEVKTLSDQLSDALDRIRALEKLDMPYEIKGIKDRLRDIDGGDGGCT